jgi:nucleotide-binding universal stress UspA family protein
MVKFKKIMVACDLSKHSKEALEYAANLAEGLSANLIIVNVINQRDLNTILKIGEEHFDRSIEQYVQKTAEEYVEREKEKRTSLIEKMMEETSCSHLAVEKVFRIGVPFQELIRVIKDEGVDILVMGAKGHSEFAALLFGSTAERMFHHCPVPLLSIRPKELG